MSFNPRVFKSVQVKLTVAGANAISSVDKDYTELVDQGAISSNTGGTVSNTLIGLSLTTNTNIQGTGQGARAVTVNEFFRGFLRQPIQYGTVTITAGNTVGVQAHGLTLGAFAYVNFLGYTGTRGPSPSGGLSFTEAQAFPVLSIAGANIQAVVNQAPYFDGDGVVVAYYCLVDPK